jgi:hypothetical protein
MENGYIKTGGACENGGGIESRNMGMGVTRNP